MWMLNWKMFLHLVLHCTIIDEGILSQLGFLGGGGGGGCSYHLKFYSQENSEKFHWTCRGSLTTVPRPGTASPREILCISCDCYIFLPSERTFTCLLIGQFSFLEWRHCTTIWKVGYDPTSLQSSSRKNMDLKQTDVAAEMRRSAGKFPFNKEWLMSRVDWIHLPPPPPPPCPSEWRVACWPPRQFA